MNSAMVKKLRQLDKDLPEQILICSIIGKSDAYVTALQELKDALRKINRFH